MVGYEALRTASLLAHSGGDEAAETLWAWSWDPGVLAGVALLGGLYTLGLRRTPRSVVPPWRIASFYFGLLTLFLALQSPLDALVDELFMLHMVQHLLLMMVAVPFLLLGAPVLPVLRGIPQTLRRRVAVPMLRNEGLRTALRFLSSPLVALVLFSGMFVGWHMPALYTRAVENSAIHSLQHLSFVLVATLFWWNVIDPVPLRPRLAYPLRLLYIFVAGIPNGILGAVLTFSSDAWYEVYAQAPRLWGIAALEDQRLGGVIMWVPGSLLSLLAVVAVAVVMLMKAEREEQAATGLLPSPNEGEAQ